MVFVLLYVFCSVLPIFYPKNLRKTSKTAQPVALFMAFALAIGGGCVTAFATAQSATSTTLAMTSGSGPATSISSGSVVTLTASVKAGGTPVTVGLVNFCDASATHCTDIHVLGTAQLTSAGTAALKFRPGIGSHSYKAVFAGTNNDPGSASSLSSLTVTGTAGPLASATAIAETGSWGNYGLTGTVTEFGRTVSPTGEVSFVDTSNGNAVLSTASLGPGVAGIGWLNPQSITSSLDTSSIVVGDFNGDGIPDLALNDNSVVVYLGNPDGTYTEAPTPPSQGPESAPMIIADFNGDGIQDLAVASYASSEILILLGKGDGTFTSSTASIPTSTFVQIVQLATADFNGDGIPDIVAIDSDSSTPAILLGNGDGTFTLEATSLPISVNPTSVAIGDFNGDGKADLAVADGGDSVAILLGNGDGTFAAGSTMHTGVSGSPVVTADFNGDGKLDLAVAGGGTGGMSESVTVLTGNGDGTFNSSSSGQNPASTAVTSIQVADFNQDGAPDVVLTDQNNSATVVLNKGDGSFSTSYPVASASSDYNFAVGVGDLNGDGYPDIAAAGYYQSGVTLLLTEPTETATATATISLAGTGQHLVTASYAGDSSYTSSASGSIPLWGVLPATTTALTLSSGGAQVTSVPPGTVVTFTATVTAGTNPLTTGQVNFCDASASSCTDIHLLGSVALTSSATATFKYVPGPGAHSYKAEFVQNGYGLSSYSSVVTLTVGPAPSVVYTSTTTITDTGFPSDYSLIATVTGYGGPASPTGNISFLDTSFGNASLATAVLGAGTAGTGWSISQTPALGGTNLAGEVTSDFNGDGIPDLAILWNPDLYDGGPFSVTILFGKGDGTFTTGPTVQPAGIESSPVLIAGDFNGDGKTDLLILNSDYTSAINVIALLGNGDGTFGTPQTSTIYTPPPVGGDFVPGSMAIADFNGDGKLDLAVVGESVIGGVTIALGNGDGTFTPTAANLEPNLLYGTIATGDLNGDGIPDLVATQAFESNSAAVFLGKGDGTFTESSIPLPMDSFSGPVVIGDFNGDGSLDLAIANGPIGGVTIFLGKGDGTFSETSGSPISGGAVSLVAGDFNHDGKLDLAGIDKYNDQVDLFIGAGDGTFTEVVTTPNVSQSFPSTILAADFNADGVPDLAMLASSISTATILLTEPTQTATATATGIAPIGAGEHDVEASYPGDSNYPSSVSGTVPLTAGLAPVVISPASGTYSSAQTVTLNESLPGATIYYQASGAVNTNGFVPYTAPIPLTEGGTESIQTYATETGYQQSNYTTANYYLNLPAAPAPVFSPAAGNYAGSQSVTISDVAPGATIYYTTNGAPPTTYARQYNGPITVSSSVTVVAAAIAPGYSLSTPISAQYLIGSSPTSLIYAVAGNGSFGYSGDGGPALLADLNAPSASLLDSTGNLYILDSGNNVVRKVAASTGVISTIVGNGTSGYSGDGGPAISAQLSYPAGMALDGQGNLYIADSGNNVVREVAAATGVITTVAGNGTGGYTGDNGPATSAELNYPASVALDRFGNLYIADAYNQVIRKVTASSGTISTAAGNGQWGYSGDGGAATAAELRDPYGVALDSVGNLYIADSGNQVIRQVNAGTGVISTFAGNGTGAGEIYGGYTGDGGPATGAELNRPTGVALDGSGNLYIADTYNQVIRDVAATTGIISTVAGGAPACNSLAGDGGPVSSAALCYPQSVFVDHSGNLYITSPNWGRIRLATAPGAVPAMAAATPTFSVAAGTYATPQTVTIADSTPGAAIYVTLDGSTPTTAGQGYKGPINVSGSVTIRAIAVGPGYLASAPTSAAYTITAPPPAVINSVAGNGVSGFSGSGGPATSAQVGSLAGVAVDGTGNLYFADTTNNVVWEVAAKTGTASIVAGNGTSGYAGDGGAATSAMLSAPNSVAVDKAGNLYIADTYNNVIRKVTASTGGITTFAGDGQLGYSGDGGPAVDAQFGEPNSVALDSAGDLYISDAESHRIRLVSATTGVITTVAGNGNYLVSGDGGLATSAGLGYPSALALDSAGNLYIASANGGRVREVVLSSGNIATVAGNGNLGGSSGDGGPATSAEIYPQAVAVDSAGNLYISDWPAAVRVVSASTGIITRLAGNGYYGYSGDGGSATVASLYLPEGIAFDASGNLYIADSGNYRVREVSSPAPTATPIISPASGSYTSVQMATITDSSKGAVIYYTTDGTAPTNTSTVYSGSIAISATTTLQAIAIAPGLAQSAVASVTYTIQLPVAPTVTVTPSATTITTAQGLSVVVTVAGPTGSPTPTGSVTLSSGSYSTAAMTLSNGSATFTIPAGSLAVGADTLTASYTPDSNSSSTYTSATGSTPVITVTQAIGTAVATVTLTPSATAVTNEQSVTVAVSVTGGSGLATPTGNLTLAGGSYSSQKTLAGGAASFSIPAGDLSAATNTLTANYSGDITYASASGTTTVTVAPVLLAVPNPPAVAPGSSTSSTVTFSAGSTYSGTMNVTCTLTASPTGAQSLPTCSLNPATITIATGGTASTVVTVNTTAASSGNALLSPGRQVWKALSGGGVLALALLFGVPSWRRRKALMMVVLVGIVVAGMVGCGGGGGSSTNPPPTTPATTAGTYMFSVSGTDSSNTKITASTNVTVTVQ